MAAHHADELKRDRLLWYRPQERQIKATEQNKAHGEQRLTYPWFK